LMSGLQQGLGTEVCVSDQKTSESYSGKDTTSKSEK
jgi:hypothetical protein